MSLSRSLRCALLLLIPTACAPVEDPGPRVAGDVAAGSFVNPTNPVQPAANAKAMPNLDSNAAADAKTNAPSDVHSPIPARKIDSSIAEALRLAQANKMPESLALLQRILVSEPDNRDALVLYAQLAQTYAQKLIRPESNKYYHESAAALLQVEKVYKDMSANERKIAAVAYYNAACTSALEKKPESAVKELQRALDAGFDELELVSTDPELDSLRARDDFKKLAAEIAVLARKQARTRAEAGLAANKPFEFDLNLSGVDGKPFKLAEYRGKVVVVDVWGTWCPPCRKELPHLAAIYEKYRDKGLAMVGLNYENGDDKEARAIVLAFLKENKVPYPCLLGDSPTRDQIPDFAGFPTTLFLDRAGVVRLRLVGYHDRADLEAVVDLLLAEPAPGKNSSDSASVSKTN